MKALATKPAGNKVFKGNTTYMQCICIDTQPCSRQDCVVESVLLVGLCYIERSEKQGLTLGEGLWVLPFCS